MLKGGLKLAKLFKLSNSKNSRSKIVCFYSLFCISAQLPPELNESSQNSIIFLTLLGWKYIQNSQNFPTKLILIWN